MARNPGARWEWRGKAARKRAESERRERERCKGCRYKGRDCERKAREEVGRVGRSFGSGWAGPDSVVLRGGHGWPWGEGTGPPPPPRPFPPFPPSTIVYGFVVHFSSVFHALCHPFLPSCVRNQHLLHTWFLVVCGSSCALSTRRIIRVVESDRYSFASG